MLEQPDINVNSQDIDGYTALMWGADNGHWGVVEELIQDQRLVPNKQDEDGHTAQTWADDKGFDNILDVAKL